MPKEKTTRRSKTKMEGRKKKDPNAPKRGLSAYMFFANENREKVRAENPGIKFGDVGKILGEKWKILSEKERAPYEAKARADKKRYEEAKAAYASYLAAMDTNVQPPHTVPMAAAPVPQRNMMQYPTAGW